MSWTVMVVDDAAAVRAHVAAALQELPEVGTVLQAKDGLQGFLLLRQQPVHLVLCDLLMPNVDGLKFLHLKAGEGAFVDTPVIMLTGQDDVQAKVQALEAGASDYLTKPFDARELISRVRVHLKIKILQDELRQKNQALESLARVDGLTGLLNRRSLDEQLKQEFSRSERYRAPVCLLMVDIDHFKAVNDTFGHPMGDRALVAVAESLQKVARVQDVVGRFGGEEFALVLPHTNREGGMLAAERQRSAVADMLPVAGNGPGPAQLTVSIGVAPYPNVAIHTVADWLGQADRALYRAKQSGRNCARVAEES